MLNQQLEIALPSKPCRRFRPARPSRARWWFNQMHRVVDEAETSPSSASTHGRRATFLQDAKAD